MKTRGRAGVAFGRADRVSRGCPAEGLGLRSSGVSGFEGLGVGIGLVFDCGVFGVMGLVSWHV